MTHTRFLSAFLSSSNGPPGSRARSSLTIGSEVRAHRRGHARGNSDLWSDNPDARVGDYLPAWEQLMWQRRV